ncbi:hypothetical protein MKX03_026204 [Papaver bracteatum]|nr:hypothetical protein MKX03_026204 [Papaver bracteatum]
MPPYWNRKYDLSIEALTWTDLIFLRSQCADSFYYYNRNTKDHNNEAVICDLEKLLKDGSKVRKRTMYEFCQEANGEKDEIDRGWHNWVVLSNDLWEEKNEEEQRRELDMRWTYLKDLLHHQGIDTSHHRLLLSMKPDPPHSKPESEGGTVEIKIGSPDRGLVSTLTD